MARFALHRVVQALIVVAGVVLMTFLVLRVVPGDPARLMLPPGSAEDSVQRVREELGTDQPALEQLIDYTADIVTGDLGRSFRHDRPVRDLVSERFPATLQLGLLAMLLALAIALPLGIAAAQWRDSVIDRVVLALALVAQSMPNFWVGILLVYLFSVKAHLLPAVGMTGASSFVLPTVTLGLTLVPVLVRTVRQNMIEALESLYVRTARAKGLPTSQVLLVHALPNASIPLVTVVGLQLGLVLGGTFVVEVVFNWPGIGLLAFQALQTRDFPVVQGVVIWVAAAFVLVNLIVDIVYGLLNPRVRLGESR